MLLLNDFKKLPSKSHLDLLGQIRKFDIFVRKSLTYKIAVRRFKRSLYSVDRVHFFWNKSFDEPFYAEKTELKFPRPCLNIVWKNAAS
jgi:hypothetical protein